MLWLGYASHFQLEYNLSPTLFNPNKTLDNFHMSIRIRKVLAKKSRNELIETAKDMGVNGYSKMRTDALRTKLISDVNTEELTEYLGVEPKYSKVIAFLAHPYCSYSITFILFIYGVVTTMSKEEFKQNFEKAAIERDSLREMLAEAKAISRRQTLFMYERSGGSKEAFEFFHDGSYEILKEKYPYGFKIFGVRDSSIINGPASDKYIIDWKGLEITRLEKSTVMGITKIAISPAGKYDTLTFQDLSLVIPVQKVNEPFSIFRQFIGNSDGPELYLELLEDIGLFPIYVMGFR